MPMKYFEYKVYTSPEGLDALVERFNEAGFYGIIINDPRDAAAFDGPGTGYEWNYVDASVLEGLKSGAYVSFYVKEGEALPAEAAEIIKDFEISRTLCDDQDWLHKWEEHYVPIRLSDHLVAKPAWKSFDPRPGDIVIEIEPGLAFGTGVSPTTYLTARLLEKYMQPGMDVLDVGCGTGILSIIARKLGAGSVTAVDLDPEAIASSVNNFRLNGCEGQIRLLQGDLLSVTDVKADLVAANLTADLQLRLLPDLPQHLRDGAVFCAGGIIDEKEELVLRAFEDAGFTILETIGDDCWRSFAAKFCYNKDKENN